MIFIPAGIMTVKIKIDIIVFINKKIEEKTYCGKNYCAPKSRPETIHSKTGNKF